MEDNYACTRWSPPNQILGYTIRSRTRIYVSYISPAVLCLFVYIVQIIADCAVSYQHFKAKQPDFGACTLCLVLAPAVITYLLVLTSKNFRSDPLNENRLGFVCRQTMQLLLFPFFVIYRFLVRVFWSIEALFHDDDDNERMRCLARSEQCSSCELYRLIQAYAQAAPQIILQLYHMLTQDLFRNYETSSVQALCLIFSAIDLAAITTSYHRFESHRKVGRHYPWSTSQQIEAQRKIIEKDAALRNEIECRKRASERTINSFPESDKIMANFRARNAQSFVSKSALVSEPKSHELLIQGEDEVDNDTLETTTALLHSPTKLINVSGNATDDDKIKINPKLRLQAAEQMRNADRIEILDTVPETPPPQPPAAVTAVITATTATAEHVAPPPRLERNASINSETMRSKRYSRPLSQLDTFKDMLIVNAQLYIKEHMPRPPKLLITRVDEQTENEKTPLVTTPTIPATASPLTPKDVVDFFLPRPTHIVNGIEQEDFAGKTVAFFGWIAFIAMRMLSLTTFCIFYPKAFFIILGVHYAVMLAALYLESRFRGSLNRTLFYLLLAYIYIFVLLEFRIKFKRIRVWYVLYLLLTMVENITMSAIWYSNEDFDSWWFGFIWEWIVYSGVMFLATIIVYYWILKPKDVTMLVEAENETVKEDMN